MTDPLDWLDDSLADLDREDARRGMRHHAGAAGPWIDLVDDEGTRRVLHLSGNSYLGLADDPRVIEAATAAAVRHGVGAGASRLVTGGTTTHQALEGALADWKGTEDAVVLSSGYLANLAVITALVGPGDTIVSDRRNHASIIDACRLSGAQVRVFEHADAEHAEQLLGTAPGRRLLVTDGVFSMDGDIAPLPELCDVAERHGAMVVVDDAHGSGILGPDGRGTAAATGCSDRVHAVVVTLSKALGAAGGAVVGSRQLAEWIRNRARPFIFDTALPAPIAAAAHESLRISLAEPQRRARAVANARTLATVVAELGFATAEPDTCIVPVVIGENAATLRAMQRLLAHDVLAVAIRPPSVEVGTARLRLTTMATHSDADLAMARDALIASLSPAQLQDRP